MSDEFLEQYKELNREKIAFATAIVLNRMEPSSGKPRDKAIILQDGTMQGWIGGGCARGIALKEALLAPKAKKQAASRSNTNSMYYPPHPAIPQVPLSCLINW